MYCQVQKVYVTIFFGSHFELQVFIYITDFFQDLILFYFVLVVDDKNVVYIKSIENYLVTVEPVLYVVILYVF